MLIADGIVFSGFWASPAVTPISSTPKNANITICNARNGPSKPLGKNPPCDQRFEKLALPLSALTPKRMIAKPIRIIAEDRDHLDDREPELELAKHADRDQVDPQQHDERDQRGIHCGTPGNQYWT